MPVCWYFSIKKVVKYNMSVLNPRHSITPLSYGIAWTGTACGQAVVEEGTHMNTPYMYHKLAVVWQPFLLLPNPKIWCSNYAVLQKNVSLLATLWHCPLSLSFSLKRHVVCSVFHIHSWKKNQVWIFWITVNQAWVFLTNRNSIQFFI